MNTLQDYVTLIKDIVSGLAAATAATIAIMGFRIWKKQLHWKTQYELAQRLLRSTYEVREAIAHVRYYVSSEDEVQQAALLIDIDDNIEREENFGATQRAIYAKRWQKIQDAYIGLDAVLLEAESIWGQEVREHFAHLRECVIDLRIAVELYLRNLDSRNPMPSTDDFMKTRFRVFDVPLDTKGKNFFSDEIATALGEVEKFLKPRLKI